MALALGAHAIAANGGGTTVTTAAQTTATSGSALYIAVDFQPSQSFTSVTDSKGNTWTQIGAEVADGSNIVATRRYRCANATGGTNHTFTLTCANSGVCGIAFVEMTTTNGNGVTFDQQAAQADTVTAFVSPNVTTTVADEMLLSMFTAQGGGGTYNHTAGNSFTLIDEITDGASHFPIATSYRVVTATGTYNASWTTSFIPDDTVVSIETFSEAAGAATKGFPFHPHPMRHLLVR